MKCIRIILTISLCLAAYLGDYVVFTSRYSNLFVFRALSDVAVHGLIGFLSALLFFSNKVSVTNEACVYNTVFCTFLSSFIDIDHFMVARSFYLWDLTSLKHRGIFHCTTFWIIITIILLTYSYISRKIKLYILTYMTVLAFMSHHIRDANRRGLWLFPFGHTAPIHRHVYVFLLCVMPYALAYLFNYTKPMYKHTVFNYVPV